MLFCEDVELMLQDYLNGYLLPSQREVLETHVRGCAECRDLVAGLTRLESRLDGLGEIDVPAGLSRSILAALPAQAYGPSPLRRALSWGAVPVLVALLVVGGFLVKGRCQLQDRAAGRVVEIVFTAPQAASVTIVGDFNGWDPRRTQLIRASHDGLWRARLKLSPGVYQYSFVIDGSDWVGDPLAKSVLADGFGGTNSVIVVGGSEVRLRRRRLRVIPTTLLGIALLAGTLAAPVAGETTSRALERVVAKGRFSPDEGARIQRAFAAARQAGVEERDALALVGSCIEGDFDALQALRMLSIAAQLALEKLPVEGFIAKVEEGVSKRIPADRVVHVAERRALMLNKAKLIINSLVLQGFSIDDRDELLPDLAAALEAGRNPDETRAILVEALQSGDRHGSIRRKLFP